MVHHRCVLGFHDYTTDARSGRPQPHASWLGERLITWTAWVSAAISVIGAVAYYVKWHEMNGPAQMTVAAVLFALIAFWRNRILSRKRATYRNAVAAYEAMLIKSMD